LRERAAKKRPGDCLDAEVPPVKKMRAIQAFKAKSGKGQVDFEANEVLVFLPNQDEAVVLKGWYRIQNDWGAEGLAPVARMREKSPSPERLEKGSPKAGEASISTAPGLSPPTSPETLGNQAAGLCHGTPTSRKDSRTLAKEDVAGPGVESRGSSGLGSGAERLSEGGSGQMHGAEGLQAEQGARTEGGSQGSGELRLSQNSL
jgi:hypothetical protein